MLKTRHARVWAKELNRIGVPAGAVLTVPEALRAPQVAERGFVATYPQASGVGRDVSVATSGVKIDGKAPRADTPPPRLGEHAAEIWGGLGLGPEEIERLAAEGVL